MAVATKPLVHFNYHDYERIARMLLSQGSDPATFIRLLLLLSRVLKLAFVTMLLYPIGLAYAIYFLHMSIVLPPTQLQSDDLFPLIKPSDISSGRFLLASSRSPFSPSTAASCRVARTTYFSTFALPSRRC